MTRSKYVVLIVVDIATMILIFSAPSPCKAYWLYLGSDVSDGPTYGYNYESGYDWQLEEEFSVTNIDTGAGSSGAYAGADCVAEASVEVTPSGTSVSKSASAWCTSWGESYYYQPDGNDVLEYDWDVYASGYVSVSGGIDDSSLGSGSADSDADAYSGVDSSGGYGDGGAWGYVYEYEDGVTYVNCYGQATENYSSTTESSGYYSASLSYSVSTSGSDWTDGDSFTASAGVDASVSCSADVSVSQGYSGSADASASADCGGDASVSVSY